MPHINLTRGADAIVIAPCSADFMAKLLHGRADDLLSLMCLARPLDSVPLINVTVTVLVMSMLAAPMLTGGSGSGVTPAKPMTV